ncbi:MAG: glycosyltransferase family 9 protein, partial [Bdellovibrionota bacterium]
LAFQLRNEKFDWVINFHASPSSSLLALATGAPVRSIHFHGHRDKNRFSTVEVPGKGTLKPVIERDMDTVRALEFDIPEGILPKLELSPFKKEEAHNKLSHLGLENPILILGLGASRPTKSWPMVHFSKVAIEWTRQSRGSAIAAVALNEVALADYFLESVDRELNHLALDSSAQTALRSKILVKSGLSVRGLAALISHASVFLGNDSGPKHLAVACGVPTVTCFGPEDPFEWHPYPKDKHPYFFISDLPCRKDGLSGYPAWCGLEVCVTEGHKCMDQIRPDEVLAACLRVLPK